MRSLSVGVAGVLISGVVLTSATVATANSSDKTPSPAPQSEAALAAFELSHETLVSTWGAPRVVVPSVDYKAEAAKKAVAEKAASKKLADDAKAEADRLAAEQKATDKASAEQAKTEQAEAKKAEEAVAQAAPATAPASQASNLSTEGASVESTVAPQANDITVLPQVVESATPVASKSAPAAPAAQAAQKVAKPAKKPAEPALQTASNSSKRATVVAAARHYASINAQTDCTALATNSIAAIGVNFHGWPADYMSLGRTVSQAEAQPGDLIYYASNGFGSSHIAVYIGNGQAVHGGWNGMGTAEFSANLPSASAPIFISMSAYNS